MRYLLAGAFVAFTAWGAAWGATTASPVKIADVAMQGDMDTVRSLVKQHRATSTPRSPMAVRHCCGPLTGTTKRPLNN